MAIRPTLLTVDLEALRHNVQIIKRACNDLPVCAVIKADAYGMGMIAVAQTLHDQVAWFGVALVEEGITLRQAGITKPILVLGGAFLGGERELVSHSLTPIVFSVQHIKALAAYGTEEKPLAIHAKIDTGMARIGLSMEQLPEFLQILKNHPSLRLEGLSTHFANADLGDQAMNERQLSLFNKGLHLVRQYGFDPPWIHMANSAAVLSYPAAHQTLARPGLSVYGLDPRQSAPLQALKPVMRWTTRPVLIKDIPTGTRVSYGGRFTAQRPTRLMTLPVGYADGYPRSLGNKACVLVRGQRAPIAGTVCMDLCMADITDISGVTDRDEVVLLGEQQGTEITAVNLAQWANTIAYEILTCIGKRVPRQYTHSHT